MCHFRVDPGLCADAEVVDHTVRCGEVFFPDGIQEISKVHEALVNDYLAVPGVHIARAVGIAVEHPLDFREAGLTGSFG